MGKTDGFRPQDVFSEELFFEITRLRVEQPALIQQELAARLRRPRLTDDGYLVVLAADHPARLATKVGSDPVGMGNRPDLLARIIRVLAGSQIDGIMATAGVLEDLVLANYLLKQRTGQSFLDNRLMIGCVNRQGLLNAVAEMLDCETGYLTAQRIIDCNLDAAKLMWRYPLDQRDPLDHYALDSMQRMARFIADCHDHNVPVMLEPIAAVKTPEGQYKFSLRPNDVIRIIGAATGLSHTTRDTWLKLPYTEEYGRVCRSTSLPILMLGGESTGRPAETIETFARGMACAPNVRGAMVGRNVIYPGEDDPAVIAQAAWLCVHQRCSAQQAVDQAQSVRAKGL